MQDDIQNDNLVNDKVVNDKALDLLDEACLPLRSSATANENKAEWTRGTMSIPPHVKRLTAWSSCSTRPNGWQMLLTRMITASGCTTCARWRTDYAVSARLHSEVPLRQWQDRDTHRNQCRQHSRGRPQNRFDYCGSLHLCLYRIGYHDH